MLPHQQQHLVSLRPSLSLDAEVQQQILEVIIGLPALSGSPIDVQVLPQLRAHRGQLLSGPRLPGIPVHAASFIRRREIVFEDRLLARRRKFRLIAIHEVFHFVWARLGNGDRRGYELLLRAERAKGARGELGESSSRQKSLLRNADSTGAWRYYVCESFCDTAAWRYARVKQHCEFTLAERWRKQRLSWWEAAFARVRGF